jgi:PPP family 3-phenylpropionic acid transporter
MPVILGLGLFYAALFAGTGASQPFIPVWFRAEGLSGGQIGLILSTPLLARAVVGPALALWADGFRLRRTPMIVMAGLATAAFAAMGLGSGFWWWMAAWFVGSTLLAALSPLTDVIALRRSRRDGFPYAWPRGVGSAGYVFANVAMGLVLIRAPAQAVLIWTIAAAAASTAGAWLLLPPDPVHEAAAAPPASATPWAGLGDLLRRPTFLLAVASIGLIQASHGFYYGFSALVWRAQGFSQPTVGLLWAFGVVVEIGFMAFMEPWRRRLGPARLLILGGAGAVVRWSALALAPALPVVVALQALHALSFTATFLASLQLIERLSPPQSASAAQTLNASVSVGLLTGLATAASGPLFDAVGARGYFAMSAAAAAGVVGAVVLAGRMRREGGYPQSAASGGSTSDPR